MTNQQYHFQHFPQHHHVSDLNFFYDTLPYIIYNLAINNMVTRNGPSIFWTMTFFTIQFKIFFFKRKEIKICPMTKKN